MMWRRAIRHTTTATLFMLCTGIAPAAAQNESEARSATWLHGASIGLPGYGDETAVGLFTIGFHGTRIEHARPGFDYSVNTMPRLLTEGVLVLGARAGVALPLALSHDLILLPSLGGTFIGGMAWGDAGGAFGGNAGLAAFILNERARGLRVGASWHKFGGLGGTPWLLELGFVRGR